MKLFLKFASAFLFIFVIIFLAINFYKNNNEDFATEQSEVISEYNEPENYEKEGPSGIMESMQFFSEVRAFPEKDIPADKYYKAFEYTKNNLQELNQDNSPTQWTSIGPNNIGGRSLWIEIHPIDTATLFIGSASGGLWKSTTGGIGANAWTRIETGFPSLAVSSIAIDSLNPNVMYIGTGETYGYQFSQNGVDIRITRGMYGIGVLKTTNGGASWIKSLDWAYDNKRGVWNVKLNPRNTNTVYAATTEGVYKSNNAGLTWNQSANYSMVMDMEINPLDTAVLYISVGDLSNNIPNANVGIYKTINAGASWTKLTNGLPAFWSGKATIDLFKGNPNTIFASIANDPSNTSNSYLGLYVSTDAGATWTQRYNNTSFMTNQGWYNNALLVKSNDVNTVVVGNLDLYKSLNGGTSFTIKSNWSAWNTGATPPGAPESGSSNFAHADHHHYASNPKEPNKLYITADGGLYRSNDFGETYFSCNGGFVTSQFYSGFANSYQDSIWCLGGLQDNRSAFYQGTVAWYKTFQGDGFWCAVNSQNDNICYTAYSYGDINRSNNRGVSWSDISPPGSGSEANYCFSAPYICLRSNPSIVIAGGISIYKSTAGGGSWQGPFGSFNGAKILSLGASSTGVDTIYAGTIPVTNGAQATIWRSVNGGNAWTDVGGGTLPNRYPTDIFVSPNDAKQIYATFGGFGTAHVYRSTNAGGSWINISGNLPDVPHWAVAIDPLFPQNIYVGNDLAVYVSTNSGSTWTEFKTGMPYAIVFDLSIVYPNRHIRATTHGNGIYERDLVQSPVGISPAGSEVPKEFKLSQNYPNPFNPSTKIKFAVAKQSNVKIAVYDITGRLISTLINQNLKPANYEIDFNASAYSSGVYFYKIETNDFVDAKKMMLVK